MPRIDYSLKLEYESPKKFGVTVTFYEVTKFSTIEMTRLLISIHRAPANSHLPPSVLDLYE